MVVNEDRFFLSHRKAIALAAAKAGFDVHIVCKDTGRRKEVEALGLRREQCRDSVRNYIQLQHSHPALLRTS